MRRPGVSVSLYGPGARAVRGFDESCKTVFRGAPADIRDPASCPMSYRVSIRDDG